MQPVTAHKKGGQYLNVGPDMMRLKFSAGRSLRDWRLDAHREHVVNQELSGLSAFSSG